VSPIEAIERATVAAVAPAEVEEIGGWLVALDPGSIRRAGSAVPLSHDLNADPDVLDAIEAAYLRLGLNPAFRLADPPGLAELRAALTERGYVSEQPTLVMTGSVEAMSSLAAPAEVLAAPDAGWAQVFVGEGFDPVDGANRVRALTRSPDAVYGLVREDDRSLAVGVAAFGHGWASIHGMRTVAARRGEGLGGRVLAALGGAAKARGLTKAFLQVEEGNLAGRALYARAGLEIAWRYLYWSKPA
jgi:ribosomal protein S18 acetylase RimI-like enzyme